MSLRDELQADIAEAFDDEDGLADAVSTFRGGRIEVGEYDPVTSQQPKTEVNYTGRGVFGGFSRQIIDQQHILSTDIKLTVLQNELIGSNGLPATPINDDIIDNLRVINVQQDAVSAVWSLQCRGTRIPAAPLSPYVLLVDENGIIWTDENGNPWIEER